MSEKYSTYIYHRVKTEYICIFFYHRLDIQSTLLNTPDETIAREMNISLADPKFRKLRKMKAESNLRSFNEYQIFQFDRKVELLQKYSRCIESLRECANLILCSNIHSYYSSAQLRKGKSDECTVSYNLINCLVGDSPNFDYFWLHYKEDVYTLDLFNTNKYIYQFIWSVFSSTDHRC